MKNDISIDDFEMYVEELLDNLRHAGREPSEMPGCYGDLSERHKNNLRGMMFEYDFSGVIESAYENDEIWGIAQIINPFAKSDSATADIQLYKCQQLLEKAADYILAKEIDPIISRYWNIYDN